MPTYATVSANSLNLRAAPSTSAPIITVLSKGTVLQVLDNAGFDWLHVRLDGSVTTGFVSKVYVTFSDTKPVSPVIPAPVTFGHDPDLLNTPLAPAQLIPAQMPNTAEGVVARVWNAEGGLLNRLAARVNVPVGGIVAVLAAESGGRTSGADGRTIIRFENHIFYNLWGADHSDIFNRSFDFDRSSPANGWKNHLWRPDPGSPWQTCHTSQEMEYRVLNFARNLDDSAALQSTSMGAPQIMGFNYKRIGYSSVQEMFNTFSSSAQAQLLAVFDFVQGTTALQALQNRDYLTFAQTYNGPANAVTYGRIIQRYSDAFDHLNPL